MSLEQQLKERSGNKCELCGAEENLNSYEVSPSDESLEKSVLVCSTCKETISNPEENSNHWHCLNDSMWNPEPAVQVTAYRILKKLSSEPWANNLLEMLYLEPEVQEWADSETSSTSSASETKDSNGTTLQTGDSVTIIKDLDVKGTTFVAKRGTAVRNIALVHGNAELIEGRVNGVKIQILTKFLKKS